MDSNQTAKSKGGGKRKTPTKQVVSSDEDSDGAEVGPGGQRREKRLEKNREAAQLFRQRQKAYLEELEKKVEELATENADSKSKIELLNSENKVIKEQLGYVRSFIGQALSGTLNPSVFNNAPQNSEQPSPVTPNNNNNNGDNNFTTMGSLMQMLTPQMQTQLFQLLTQPNGANSDLNDLNQQIELDPSFFQLLPDTSGANNEHYIQTEKENQ